MNYGIALEEFLHAATKLQNIGDIQGSPALRNICNAMQVGTLEFTTFKSAQDETKDVGDTLRLFSSPQTDFSTNPLEIRKIIGADTVVVYRIYPPKGLEEWDMETQSRIRMFLDLLQTFETRNRQDKLIERLTYYDRVMGIPNLPFFMRQLGILGGQGRLSQFGACFFDFVHFGVVNAQLGRNRGDEIMLKFVKILQSKLGPGEYVCRIGGDNFAALFRKEHLPIVQTFLEGYPIEYDPITGEKMLVETRAGYYMPEPGLKVPQSVMDHISEAHSIAKNEAKKRCIFYDAELGERRVFRRKLEMDFPGALARGDFKVYYQLKVQLDTRKPAGAEALCRWFRDGEILLPEVFISVLEQGKNICKLDFYILECVCKDIRRWLDEGRKVVPIAVNLSGRHLGNLSLSDHLIEIIDRYQVPHDLIEFEVTESLKDRNIMALSQLIKDLSEAGIAVAADHFGIGYSSVSLFCSTPWSELKLDSSMLPDEEVKDDVRKTVCGHLVGIAREMGIRIVGEGIETEKQAQFLQSCGCNLGQGYLFDVPSPVDEFEKKF